ncbi:MAG: hypothetical protein A2Z16_02980 [Chloroflexi bacterium RBG_16_54_18]|nr:MAG: hypothetical protein A2Z16_02980 [Chloroflexi bacterium RBG_16_54_18]
MLRYILVSLGSGLLFGVLDALLNANPLAVRLFSVYKPIARNSVNPLAGILIDIAYGFIMAGIFLLLYESLPGPTGIVKGLSFGLLAWFFRVVMQAASSWVMFEVPLQTAAYSLIAGLLEMLLIGLLYGLTLKPFEL